MSNEELTTWLDDAIELSAALAVGYALSRFVRVAIARGESMLPTIKHNHPVLLDCTASRRAKIKAQDIVAFRPRLKGQHTFFLKRVIGVSGDEVMLTKDGLFVNHQLVQEPYLHEPMRVKSPLKITVKEDELFVLGDNRQHSLDSRSPRIGCVSKQDVLGVVRFKI